MTDDNYKKQRKIWYKKLEVSGFKDIELNDFDLKNSTSVFYRKKSNSQDLKSPEIVWNAKVDYYTMAEHFLTDHKFASNLDKIIWEYHTNGISMRNIVKLLHSTKITKTNRDSVWKTIKTLADEMKKLYGVR